MPELPDLSVYVDHLRSRVCNERLLSVELKSPFLLRTAEPAIDEFTGKRVREVQRLAKQIVLAFDEELFMVFHLMIAGRFQWRSTGKPGGGRILLARFEFESGSLLLTEASKKKRAALRLVRGDKALQALDPGGLEIADVSTEEFAERLRETNHTLKRALTDQRVFAGIGNAYSDEILLRARLSPFKRAAALADSDVQTLLAACKKVLEEWSARLGSENADRFPAKVTAFHPRMAAHGKYGEPCPQCDSPIQRIRYADNEANYCARCQTDGRLLADRSLSRLLKDNWPKRLEDLEGG